MPTAAENRRIVAAVRDVPGHRVKVAVVASNDICHHTNPRKCEREDFERIVAAAL